MPRSDLVQQVRSGGLIPDDSKVLVMLSGGRDSVCLLDVAHRIVGGQNLIALHVNYRLRAGADEDETFCRQLCSSLQVEIVTHRPKDGSQGNLQAWARDERYRVAREVAQRVELESRANPNAPAGQRALIATAHTASDQIETILYRLASSPGRRALLGIRPKDGNLIRPLLGFDREQITAYCNEKNLSWREDPTNKSDRFARNRVRNHVIPALLTIHPSAGRNIATNAQYLRDEADVLDLAVNDALEGLGERPLLSEVGNLPAALARLVLQRLAEGEAKKNGLANPIPARINGLLELAQDREKDTDSGTVLIDVGGGLSAVLEYGHLRFECIKVARDPQNQRSQRETQTQKFQSLQDPKLQLENETVHPIAWLNIPGKTNFLEGSIDCITGEDLPISDSLQRVTIDLDTLGDRATVRTWRDGDRMRPLGLGGTKKLHDLFIDQKVGRLRRPRIPVIEAQGGEIIWIPGIALSESVRITNATTRRATLSWHEVAKP